VVVALHALKALCIDDGQCTQIGQGLHEFLLNLGEGVRPCPSPGAGQTYRCPGG
jgi:hypothetical protein